MIIECPKCRIHYEVGDTLPPEGMNVRCAECHEVWLAKPINIAPPALQTNDNTTDTSHDIVSQPDTTDRPDATDTPDTIPVSATSETSETVTTENVDAKAGKRDLPAFPSSQFDQTESVDEINDIHRDQLFDEVHDEIYSNDPNISADLDRQFEPAAGNGLTNGNLSSSIAANGHSLSADRLTSTNIGEKINKEIDSIAVDPAETPASMPASKHRIPGLVFFSWVTVFAAVAGILLSAFMMPNRVARKFPVTVGFYDALGIDVNSRGLVIQDVQYEHSEADGRPALILNGNVLNITDDPLKVPTVVAELRDKDGLILFVWATEVKTDSLDPNKIAPFSATIPAPTELVRQVKLRFSTRP